MPSLRASSSSQGFSLVEILVVIVVLGVLMSMVSMTFGSHPGRQARAQAQTLVQWLQAAREQAVLEGREYGVQLAPDGWQLQRQEGNDWVPVGKPLVLPAGLEATLLLQGQPVSLALGRQPHLLAMSSDELSAFELQLHSAGQHWLSVRSDGLAEPTLHE